MQEILIFRHLTQTYKIQWNDEKIRTAIERENFNLQDYSEFISYEKSCSMFLETFEF